MEPTERREEGFPDATRRTIGELCERREGADLMVRASGQVVHIRRKSHALAFIDLRSPGDDGVGAGGRVTAVCKDGTLSAEGMREVRATVRLGDIVEVVGLAQSVPATIPCLLTLCMRVRAKWVEAHPALPFAPQPLGARAFQATPLPTEPRTAQSGEAPRAPPRDGDVVGNVGGCAQAVAARWCVHFISTGRCHVVGCTFEHGIPPCGRAAWLREYRAARAVRGSCADDPHAAGDKKRSSQRARIFASWLVQTYGAERLRAGSGVLDVAGGRGDVAFELQAVCGIRATVVDPRAPQPRKEHYRHLAAHPDAMPAAHVRARFDEAFAASAEHAGLVRSASLIVGMHPDEATGAVVEIAAALRVPFAVVPCCVFARAFPQRVRPSDGAPVSSHEDLLEWLASRTAPGEANSCFLPFAGKNRVVYTLGYGGSGGGELVAAACAS